MKKKIRVLVVDDSMLYRKALKEGLESDPSIEVVGMAGDPFEARDRIVELRPDVMTLDIQMPRMNGIQFLRKLMPQYPLPVVVVSSISSAVFDATDAGAVDFVSKPSNMDSGGLKKLVGELTVKIKVASMSNVSHWKKRSASRGVTKAKSAFDQRQIIGIGASTGGTEAIYEVIKEFPSTMPGVVIVQHMPAGFTKLYADRMNKLCRVEVKEAQNGDQVLPGRVLLAPASYQMQVIKKSNGFFVKCYESDKVSGHCPSVDVLFESLAKTVGQNSVAVILTGMGRDGAKGMLDIKHLKGRTIGQDQASSVVYGMPKVAHEIGAVEFQMSLNEIAGKVVSLVSKK